MRLFIDGNQRESQFTVFSMTLVERHLAAIAMLERQLRMLDKVDRGLGTGAELRRVAEARMRPTEIVISIPEDSTIPASIPRELLERLPVRWSRDPGTLRQRLRQTLHEANGEAILIFPGNAVVDVRVYQKLAWWTGGGAAVFAGEGKEASCVLRLEADFPDDAPADETDLRELGLNLVKSGAIKALSNSDVVGYISKLRRTLPAYIIRVTDDASRLRVERFLFHSNYKGSTDFLTKWVYPPIVWQLLKPLTRWRVHPNAVTSVAIACTFLAVPFFCMAGTVGWSVGLALAYTMSILDSVDGKLARVHFKSTAQGDVLDHGLDIIHPPFWYFAWAWGLSGGDPYSSIFQAALWLAGLYILDRVMETLFKAATGNSIADFRPIDVKLRTFISRRNVNLAVFSVALPLGFGVEAFYFVVGWQLFTLLFHSQRVIQYWHVRPKRAESKRSTWAEPECNG